MRCIVFFSTLSSLSTTLLMAVSCTVADAAVGCPPPPNSCTTAPTSTSRIRLLATMCILSSMRTTQKMTSMFSMSRILCDRTAMS